MQLSSWTWSSWVSTATAPLYGSVWRGNHFLSSAAVLGSGLQMGVIPDGPHTVLKGWMPFIFMKGGRGWRQIPLKSLEIFCENWVNYTFFNARPFGLAATAPLCSEKTTGRGV